MLHPLTKRAVRTAAFATLACLGLAACTGVPLSAPPLPAPPPPPAKAAIVWTPREAPRALQPAPSSGRTRPALTASAAPPPAPVFRSLQLEPVPEVTVPRRFCSVDDKYAFIHDRQLPAYDAAMRNSAAANAYKAELSDLYVQYRDATAGGVHSGEVMAELKRVDVIADQAFTKAAETQKLFDVIMARPVTSKCRA